MIAAEYRTDRAVVRIHDDSCGLAADGTLLRISSVVSASYKRRSTERTERFHSYEDRR